MPNHAVFEGIQLYVIDADNCTECVGYFDEPNCKSICPTDCLVPDPAHLESRRNSWPRSKAFAPTRNERRCVQGPPQPKTVRLPPVWFRAGPSGPSADGSPAAHVFVRLDVEVCWETFQVRWRAVYGDGLVRAVCETGLGRVNRPEIACGRALTNRIRRSTRQRGAPIILNCLTAVKGLRRAYCIIRPTRKKQPGDLRWTGDAERVSTEFPEKRRYRRRQDEIMWP